MFDVLDLRDRCRKAALHDVAVDSDEDLCTAALELVSIRRAVDAAEAHVLAELDARAVCDREFGTPTARWIAARTGEAPGGCTARVKVANALRRHFGQFDRALTAGDVGWSHAKTLCDAANARNVDGLAALEDALIELARQATFDRYRNEVRGLADLLDQDGGHEPDPHRSNLRLTPLVDGYTDVSGALHGEIALTCREAIEQETNRLYRQYQKDHKRCPDIEIPPRATLRAMALAELCRKALARDINSTQPPRVEAVIIINPDDDIDGDIDGDAHDGAGDQDTRTDEDTDEDTEHVDHEHHANRAQRRGLQRLLHRARITTLNGEPLDANTISALLVDPHWQAMLLSQDGVPLNLGTAIRFANAQQRKALAVRDGGCVFPGCSIPVAWTDAHHVIWAEHGGPTDLRNLASLCRHHHGVTHRTGWTMTSTADQWYTWTTPSGDTLQSQRHGLQRAGP